MANEPLVAKATAPDINALTVLLFWPLVSIFDPVTITEF